MSASGGGRRGWLRWALVALWLVTLPVYMLTGWQPGGIVVAFAVTVGVLVADWCRRDNARRQAELERGFTEEIGRRQHAHGCCQPAPVDAEDGHVQDGHGTIWIKCGPNCDLQVVRPGKVQCSCRT